MSDDSALLRQLPETMSDGVVLLDGFRSGDAEEHLLGEDDEMRRRFDAERPATLEETRSAIDRWIAARAAGGPMFAYALRDTSGRLMGGCELRVSSVDSASVSYWLFPMFRGRGYAVRALELLCAAATKVRGLDRLEARISPENHNSQRVVERVAFVSAGKMEQTAPTGARSTVLLYVREVGGAGGG